MKKLAIISTHPIQYNAPWFRMLAAQDGIELKVFYTWSQAKTTVEDRTFGKQITWDIPLLEGYDYDFVENVSKNPGSHHFFGIDCPSLIPKIEDFKPDAILLFGWNFKSYLKTMRHFKGKVPIWFRGDSTLLDEKLDLKTFLRRIVLKRTYSRVDKAFYVGRANKNYFLKHGLSPKQLIYTPHAIDNERFAESNQLNYEDKAKQWRNELGYREEDLVVLFAGKFENKKQPDFLIEAFVKANIDRDQPLHLLMVGSGPLETDLKEHYEGQKYIKFLPFQNQSQMPMVYRLGNVLCLPSKGPGETWGLAVNEAMACSRSAIVSNKVGCAEDLVKEGRNGYTFSYDAPDELIEILKKLSIPELEKLGAQAFSDIQAYNFDAIVNSITKELVNLKAKKGS